MKLNTHTHIVDIYNRTDDLYAKFYGIIAIKQMK